MVDSLVGRCPACGADNACGAARDIESSGEASAEKCWCMSLPPVKNATQWAGDEQPLRCFCQRCLLELRK